MHDVHEVQKLALVCYNWGIWLGETSLWLCVWYQPKKGSERKDEAQTILQLAMAKT